MSVEFFPHAIHCRDNNSAHNGVRGRVNENRPRSHICTQYNIDVGSDMLLRVCPCCKNLHRQTSPLCKEGIADPTDMQNGDPVINLFIYYGEKGAYVPPAGGITNVANVTAHLPNDWASYCEWQGEDHCKITESRPTAPSPSDMFDRVILSSKPPVARPWHGENKSDARSKRTRSFTRPKSTPPQKTPRPKTPRP